MKIPTLALILAFGAPLAALAATDTPAMSGGMHAAPDCATANTMMMSMPAMSAKPGEMTAMSSSAGLDQNFAAGMHAMSGHAMEMAKLEAACGKDPKTRALAQKMLEDLQDFAQRLQMREREGY